MNFTNDWFEKSAKPTWDNLIPLVKPKRILEIGSYEGKSICYLIEKLGNQQDLEIHAVDSWLGGMDHISREISLEKKMFDVEARFDANTKEIKTTNNVTIHKHKGFSEIELAKLVASQEYKDYFDFIYVDGSHETTETLSDMVLAFKLLRPGGIMAIDDYLWCVDLNPDFRPKLAIDSFINLHLSKINIIPTINLQAMFVKKG